MRQPRQIWNFVANLPSLNLRRLVRAANEARDRRSRVPPALRVGDRPVAPPLLYYLSPDPSEPRGGVRVFYRHVDLLNEAGFAASVLHSRPGYRADWFPNTTRVAAASDVVLAPQDLLVVPEFYGGNLDRLPAGPRLAVFNQGPYYTFVGVDPSRAAALAQPPVEAILTVSEDSLDLLGYTFENTPVHYARSVVDGAVFHPAPAPGSRRRIAFTLNRRPAERHQLLSILAARGRVAGWDLVPISGMSEAQVANTLRTCAIFLSFSERDGFGLPPAEAMACGCYVIGYHGQGGKEFFSPDYCKPIADNDTLAFAREVEAAVESYDRDPAQLSQAGLDASREVLARYHPDGLRADLVAFFASLGINPVR